MRALIAALSVVLFAPQVAAIDVGDIAPSIQAKTMAGNPMTLSAFNGKVVYLDFWASWCAPCKQSFPWMNAMAERYSKDGLAIVAISVDKKSSDVEKFLKQMPAQFDIGHDPEGLSASTYKVKAMPSSVLIDSNGKVLYVHEGFRSSDTAQLEAHIKNALEARLRKK
jgi:cytochrome c biogenesis protein CcmG, thiol:disulfide interchange protein DsbE